MMLMWFNLIETNLYIVEMGITTYIGLQSERSGVRSLLGSPWTFVFLSKAHLLSKSTGNTHEAVAPSRHDLKIVYRDVKQ